MKKTFIILLVLLFNSTNLIYSQSSIPSVSANYGITSCDTSKRQITITITDLNNTCSTFNFTVDTSLVIYQAPATILLDTGKHTLIIYDCTGAYTIDTINVLCGAANVVNYTHTQSGLNIFPNPSTGNVFITPIGMGVGNVTIVVTDITGKVLHNEQMTVTNSFVNFNLDVKAGTYFVTIVNAHTNEKIIKKLVIE